MEKIAAAAEARKQQGSGGLVGGAVGMVGDAAGAGAKVSALSMPSIVRSPYSDYTSLMLLFQWLESNIELLLLCLGR